MPSRRYISPARGGAGPEARPADAGSPRVTVYGHGFCHLCRDMEAALGAFRGRLAFVLEVVDIEGDEALEARFGEKVPVLFVDGVEICHYHLDEAAFLAALSSRREEGSP